MRNFPNIAGTAPAQPASVQMTVVRQMALASAGARYGKSLPGFDNPGENRIS